MNKASATYRAHIAGYVGAIILLIALFVRPLSGAVTWTGTGGISWATTSSWSNNSGPSTFDTASFTDTGSTNLLGDITSLLNADRTIGGLSFSNTANHYQTLDLATHTLTVTGNLSFNVDQSQNNTATIRDGILVVNSPFANISVGRSVSSSASGIADLSGLASLTAALQSLQIGTSTSGSANGTLTLSPSNNIITQLVDVGASSNSGDTNGTLHLGLTNTIATPEFDIAQNNSNARVDIASGGSLSIGTFTQRTLLQIANQTTNTNNTYSGVMDLGNAAVNLHLDSLIVAEKDGGPGGATGQLLGGCSGSINIGDPTARGAWYVGYTPNGGNAQGLVDFSRLGTLQAYLSDFFVGRAIAGSATGTVSLAATSNLDVANSIIVGASPSGGSGTLTLGHSTTILANQFTVGQDYTSGSVQVPSGATLTLGSATQRTLLQIANQNTNSLNTYTGLMDLSNAAVNLHLDSLIVAQKLGGPGGSTGQFFGGGSGAIAIGDPATRGNWYVAYTINGGGTQGTVDFSHVTTLQAYLNDFFVGKALLGSATGIVSLAAATNLDVVNSIIVGAGSGDGSSSLALGHNNTILVNQLIIGQDYSNGSVTIPAGGSLTLGAPARRANLSIGVATTNTLNTYSGSFDLTNASLVAYLDSVVVGNKNAQPGNEIGTLTISNHPDNLIDANTVSIGGNQSTGTLNFGGGTFFAGSITAGAGTANFNWTGGQLSVGTFGSAALLFNLNNTGTGTLAPGSAGGAIGTTAIFGNYAQASSAAMAIRIAGDTPGTGNDLVAVSGTATLAGSLRLTILNGFVPPLGDNFLIASYASHSGTFAFVAPPQLPQNAAFQLDYTSNPTQLLIHIIAPTPQNWTSSAAAATFATPANWNTLTSPTTTSALTMVDSSALNQTVMVNASITVHRISLSGTTNIMNLQIPQGIQLGVANQLVVGTNSTLTGGGQVLGSIVLAGGSFNPDAAATLTLAGSVADLGGGGPLRVSGSAATLLITGPATYSGLTTAGAGATVEFGGGLSHSTGSLTGPGTVLVDAGATLTSGLPSGLGNLHIDGAATIRSGSMPGGAGKVASLILAGAPSAWTAQLDLTNNNMIVVAGSNIPNQIGQAANLGAWTGPTGITSTTAQAAATTSTATALAYASGAEYLAATGQTLFSGQPFSPTDTLIKYTLAGDANMDGSVTFADFLALQNNYNHSGDWSQGDWNYDGQVTFADFLILQNNYNKTLAVGAVGSILPVTTPDSVPEPATLEVLLFSVAGVISRRARR